MSPATEPAPDLAHKVAELDWYHTLELGPGITTPGWFDTRPVARALPWPDLSGKRCLDIGTFDGFWAFEMERRGAAEVVAIDLNDPDAWEWPATAAPEVIAEIAKRKGEGDGFELAREALGSKVERHELSVYELDAAGLGSFDFIYLGSLLIHLRDPVAALMRVRAVCQGLVMVVDVVDVGLSIAFPRRPMAALDARGRPWWWRPNRAALVRMLEAAGFRLTGAPRRVWMPPGRDQHLVRSARALLTRDGREAALRALKGDPHLVLLAAPA
jgi:tRNA (mo5U34)-methyltransferase